MGSLAQRQIGLALSILGSFFLTYQIIHNLSFLKTTDSPEIYLIRVALSLGAFFFPIFGGWFFYRFPGSVIFLLYASILVLFSGIISSSPVFVWFLIEYGALCVLFYRMDQYYENQVASLSVDIEKFQNERNDLETSYKVKGEGISMLFEKYAVYYNLRKLAGDLATTLKVGPLSNSIIERSMDFIPNCDCAILCLAQGNDQDLHVMAYRFGRKGAGKADEDIPAGGDIFDLWVIKNRRRLIVTDTHQDFRFDLKELHKGASIRSLIIAPLIHEGRVIGTIRVQSRIADNFSNDDLRLLDTIAVIASSAVSNAIMFEQTEELAIQDSLTGLFVRRYFFERMKEEHRRALMTQRPLSLLMCDLDHFKECNDRYGHGVGDIILIHFAQIMKDVCENAIIGRYGGEEFVVLLTETNRKEAEAVGNQIRHALQEKPVSVRRESIALTVSIGVAGFPDDTLDLETILEKADKALYQAKRTGRDKVCLSE